MIYGLTSDPLPDGWTPLSAVAIVKCLDRDGTVRLCSRYTDSLNTWEALGMLTAEQGSLNHQLTMSFTEDDDA